MKRTTTALLLFFTTIGFTQAQDYSIRLETGELPTEPNIEAYLTDHTDQVFDGRYYQIVQFNSTPLQDEKVKMEASGMRFFEYLPNYAYLVSFPQDFAKQKLKTFNVRCVLDNEPEQKISVFLKNGIPAKDYVGGEIQIILSCYADVNLNHVVEDMQTAGYEIEHQNDLAGYVVVTGDYDDVKVLSEKTYVKYIDHVPSFEPDDNHGRGLHRSLNINTYDPLGKKYDGSGVVVTVNDDGFVGPHIDFKNRTEQSTVASDLTGDHGDMVAGILGGAGNLDPKYEGMAKGVFIHVRQYSSLLPNTVSLHQNDSSMIFSSSYSNGCNAGYTALTNQVDQEIRQNPSLIQVFSAGNSGTLDCGYGAGSVWGNITGGHKQGKNVIATANLDRDEDLMTSSSRGPAHDGRIKPDIAANGNNQISTDPNNGYSPGGGTSAAAPGISGITAQLYHAYKTLNGGTTPESALIKACLLNSAEDFGNAGPDFRYGWGRVHALRALDILENNQYSSDSITQGQSKSASVVVPSGVKEVRIMVYWNDYEAAANASIALVNDIDMTVTDGSTTFEPWLLDHTPNTTALNTPAGNGADHLNNMEQVAIVDPAAGTYTVNIDGFNIPQGPQKYYVVYTFIYDEIKVIYPNGGEGFIPGDVNRIFWDAYGNTGTFTLEYSSNDGTTWNTVSTVSGASRSYNWLVPSGATGLARFRITRGGDSDITDTIFSVLDDPNNLHIESVCPDSIELNWDHVGGASSYVVYRLGNKYMDSIGTTTQDTFLYALPNINDEEWFSVAAVPSNNPNIVGSRALAIHYDGSGVVNCTQSYDLSPVTIVTPGSGALCDASDLDVSIFIENAGANTMSNFDVHYKLSGQATVTETYSGTISSGAIVSYTFSTPLTVTTPGNYTLDIWTTDPLDQALYNDTITTNFEYGNNVISSFPNLEDFESMLLCNDDSNCEAENCALSGGWLNEENLNEDDIDWRVNQGGTPSSGTGPQVDHTTGNIFGNYVYLEASNNCFGKEAVMVSPCIDLTGQSAAHFTFWYNMRGGDMGSLHVDIFNGSLWILDVIPPISGDQGSEWNQAGMSLSQYVGDIIKIRFRGITGTEYQSDMAIDDINIDNTVSIYENELSNQIMLYPNPSNQSTTIGISLMDAVAESFIVTNVLGEVVHRETALNLSNGSYTLNTNDLSNGLYFIDVRTSKGHVTKQLLVQH